MIRFASSAPVDGSPAATRAQHAKNAPKVISMPRAPTSRQTTTRVSFAPLHSRSARWVRAFASVAPPDAPTSQIRQAAQLPVSIAPRAAGAKIREERAVPSAMTALRVGIKTYLLGPSAFHACRVSRAMPQVLPTASNAKWARRAKPHFPTTAPLAGLASMPLLRAARAVSRARRASFKTCLANLHVSLVHEVVSRHRLVPPTVRLFTLVMRPLTMVAPHRYCAHPGRAAWGEIHAVKNARVASFKMRQDNRYASPSSLALKTLGRPLRFHALAVDSEKTPPQDVSTARMGGTPTTQV